MFRWNLMLRTLFGSPRQQSKARRPKPPAKPHLEELTQRILPSASPFPAVSVASPPAVPSVAAITSFAASMMDLRSQLIATIEQDLSNALNTLGQEITQEASSIQQQWDNLLGISPSPQNQPINAAVSPSGSDSGAGRGNASGSGSGSGATMTHNAPNQSLNNSTQQTGRGSGSGSNTTTDHASLAGQGGMKMQPMTSGTGSGSFGIGGSGTGSLGTGTGSGHATVSGQVWLDNNGDGAIDNGEQGYNGIEVDLIEYSTSQPGVIVGRTPTTTNQYGYYSFNNIPEGPDAKPYAIQVIFSSVPYVDVWATLRTPNVSQIDGHGTSGTFYLNDGAWRQVEAGVVSMDVNVPDDDPTAALGNNEVTLRDAIDTGDEGGGLGHGNNIEPVRFINPLNGQPLTGTITLQKELDPITQSYNIVGSGADVLTVQGGGQANPFRIFKIKAGVTSTISGLTIKNGYVTGGLYGAGVDNWGTLYLTQDVITNNTVGDNLGNGGGVYNASGADLWLTSTNVQGNSASASDGGGVFNSGTLTICCGSEIDSNNASYGGGLYNMGVGKVALQSKSAIGFNEASSYGGGVYNDGGTLLMSSGTITFNSAGVNGGGIYNNVGSLTLTNFTIGTNNSAGLDGGGMYLAKNSTTTFQDCTVSGNSAYAGTGVYWQNNATVKGLATLTDNDDPNGEPVQGP